VNFVCTEISIAGNSFNLVSIKCYVFLHMRKNIYIYFNIIFMCFFNSIKKKKKTTSFIFQNIRDIYIVQFERMLTTL